MKKITPMQQRDTCLALTFLLLLIWLFTKQVYLVHAAMILLLLGMALPSSMTLPARAWFGLSHLLGQVMSRVLLGVIYVVMVLPVSLVRRMIGKDSLRLKPWKRDEGSCFVERDHVFTADDLKNPY